MCRTPSQVWMGPMGARRAAARRGHPPHPQRKRQRRPRTSLLPGRPQLPRPPLSRSRSRRARRLRPPASPGCSAARRQPRRRFTIRHTSRHPRRRRSPRSLLQHHRHSSSCSTRTGAHPPPSRPRSLTDLPTRGQRHPYHTRNPWFNTRRDPTRSRSSRTALQRLWNPRQLLGRTRFTPEAPPGARLRARANPSPTRRRTAACPAPRRPLGGQAARCLGPLRRARTRRGECRRRQ
jgi:hypothetical protein